MQISKGYSDLSSIEFYYMLRESLIVKQMIIKVSTSNVFQEKVNSIFILKDIVHAQDKRMIRLKQYLFLVFSVLYLLLINQNIFIYSLHGI